MYDPKNEDIVIFRIGNNYNRFQVALDIQNACNPSGVALELVRVIQSAQLDPISTGTDFVRGDPAVVLVVDKLFDLIYRRDVLAPVGTSSSWFAECERLAKEFKKVDA